MRKGLRLFSIVFVPICLVQSKTEFLLLLLLLLSSSLYNLNVESIHKACSSLPLVLYHHLYFPNRVVQPATIVFQFA